MQALRKWTPQMNSGYYAGHDNLETAIGNGDD